MGKRYIEVDNFDTSYTPMVWVSPY